MVATGIVVDITEALMVAVTVSIMADMDTAKGSALALSQPMPTSWRWLASAIRQRMRL